MKITKRGTPPTDRMWRGRCRACGSEADATQAEMTHIKDDSREGTQFSWEKCAVCGRGDRNGYGGILFYPSD